MALTRQRVLIAHPRVTAAGGGNAVAAWAIEALRDEFEVTVATLQPIDCEAVNRSFGTSLRESDFHLHLAPQRYHELLRTLPTAGALLEVCLTMRLAQEADRHERFDVLLGTQNEIDFGRYGLQYVHHPWVYLPRPEHELRWFHRIPGFLWCYRSLCARVARSSNEGLRRNLSIANSKFIAGRIRETHHVDSVILFPPVPGNFPDTPWEQRKPGFVGLGRLHHSKRWDMVVSILDEVRRRGHDVSLTLIGHSDDLQHTALLTAMAEERPWLRLLQNISRDQLTAEVASCRYGLHAMQDEHFGIAPAELQRAGCIVFVHNSGGPIEIVGGDTRRIFNDVADAADKIDQMLRNPVLESDMRRHVLEQRERFTAEAFCEGLRALIRDAARLADPSAKRVAPE